MGGGLREKEKNPQTWVGGLVESALVAYKGSL